MLSSKDAEVCFEMQIEEKKNVLVLCYSNPEGDQQWEVPSCVYVDNME